MDRDLTNFIPQNGMDVIGADGEKVGEIDAVERDYFVVRKGFFFPQDHYIPMTAISSYDEDGKVYLNVTKDEALEQEWGNPPQESTGAMYDQGTTTAGADNYGQGDLSVDDQFRSAADLDRTANVDPTYADTDVTSDVTSNVDAGYADRDLTTNVDRDHETIEVVDEELTATTRPVERGEVRVHKDVVEEQQTLEVPVTEEEVEITRRRVDRGVTDADHAFEEGTIEVPLRGEEVDVEKRARVVEEIDIDKTARQRTERVSDTVRHEEVQVDGDNIDVDETSRNRNRVDDDLI
jgi:uncharacterized protein (TIGR02271 family)